MAHELSQLLVPSDCGSNLGIFLYLGMALRFTGSKVIRTINGMNLIFYPRFLPQPSMR